MPCHYGDIRDAAGLLLNDLLDAFSEQVIGLFTRGASTLFTQCSVD